MEKLSRRSDGIFETQSGLFAIQPKRASGGDGENYFFDFHPRSWDPPVRIRWPAGDPIAVIDQSIALLMLQREYAYNITQSLADIWNARIDQQIAADATDPAQTPADGPASAEAAASGASTESAGEPEGGAAISPNTPPLTPPEVIADAVKTGDPNPEPSTVIESLVPSDAQSSEETEEPAEEADEEIVDENGKPSGKKGKTKRSL